MRRVVARVARELPPSAAAALAIGGIFVVVSVLAAVAPPRVPVERSDVLAAASPTATMSPSAAATASASAVPAPSPRPSPQTAPVALGVVPEAGGIVFRHCCESGRSQGIWRYDGRTGTLERVGTSGEPTVDGRGYVVREDDAHYVRIDAAMGTREAIAPHGALGADAAPAGSELIGAYVEGEAWVLPRSGAPWRVAEGLAASSVRFSPDGTRLVLVGTTPPPADRTDRRVPNELWAVDLPHGTPRRLVRLEQGSMGPTFQLGGWSPDATLLAYFEISVSNSMNADGVRLRAVDVRTSAIYDLGTTLSGASRLSWKAPHTLAYVSGGSRMTWDHKTVRIWSPETGLTNVTTSGVGLNPSWSADGTRLYLITADEHEYVPVDYFAGRDSGARRLSVYDVATKRITTLAPPGASVYEGVRESRDGSRLLVVWRPTHVVTSLPDLPPIMMTLGLLDRATGRATPLVRIGGDVGFGYYGSYDGPEGMAWSEGR